MASVDSNFGDFFCSVVNLNNKNVNAFIASELSEFTSTYDEREISRSLLVQVNAVNSLAECVNLYINHRNLWSDAFT